VSKLTDHVVFNDKKLAERYANRPIPMSTLFEAYFDGAIDIPGDLDRFLDDRDLFVTYSLTPDHVKFFFQHFIPEATIHSKRQDERIVREHYDRGDDFFGAFLGDRMVYTCGFFKDEVDTVEEAQDQKMDLVCEKLMVKPGEAMLDIGCGWGTLALHAARKFGADSTGITISKNQTAFGNERIRKAGLSDRSRLLCLDYRDIPKRQFDKISSLEMVEHVGVKNFQKFCNQVYDLLKDEGLFLLQWTGLRRGMLSMKRPEDLIWALFMNKYIFPGADASLPLSNVVRGLENAGFEIHSAENISVHYALTIQKWHKNWLANKDLIIDRYGERWFRIWHLFLGWSARIGFQGNAACFQVVANKNLDRYNRKIFVGRAGLGEQKKRVVFEEPQPALSKSKNGKRVQV
jgi:sphingolipid C9-methyltransferase